MKKILIELVVAISLLLDVYLAAVIVGGSFRLNLPLEQMRQAAYYFYKPNVLKVTRSTDPLNAFPLIYPPFEKTIHDPDTVQRLYKTILALPILPTPRFTFCTWPGYNSLDYHLGFFQKNDLIMQATVSFNGCGQYAQVQMNGKSYLRDFDNSCVSLLANSLGVTEDELLGRK